MKREDRDLIQTRRLEFFYIIALTLVALLTIASQYLIHNALKKQDSDSTIIRIAGRQSMLSQKITKSAFAIYFYKSQEEREQQYDELKESLQLWIKSHNGLIKGDKEMNLPGENSPEIVALFNQIEPNFNQIVKDVKQILQYYESKYIKFDQFSDASFKRLVASEGKYLEGMNLIVRQYENEAKGKIDQLRRFEISLLVITLCLLLLEALFIFRPAYKKIHETIQSLHASRSQLIKANEILKNSENQIRQKMEEVQNAQNQAKAALEEVKNRELLLAELNEDMLASLEYARRIQQAILPDTMHINAFLPNNFMFFEPKHIVSGDFYWFLDYNDYFYLAAADCTGHGVPGAFMSMLGISMLNAIVRDGYSVPSDILAELHKRVILTLKQQFEDAAIQDGMDIALVRINREKTKMDYAGANRPLVMFKNNEMIRLDPNKMPIGQSNLDDRSLYRNYEGHAVDISEGCSIYLYSDGITDQFSENEKKYSNKSFMQSLQEIHTLPLGEQYKKIRSNFYEWKGNALQTDDVLVIGVQI